MDEHVERLQSGDRDAAEALIARYEMRVRLYAAKVAPRAGMAEDIAQKAFLLALQNIHKFDPAGDFGVWMCGIVRNVGRQEWKRLATHSRVERDGLSDYIEEIAEMPASSSSEGEWIDNLRDCVDRLPDRAKEIVKLHYSLGISCKEVADRTHTQVGAVKMALVRIRRMLKECISARLAGDTR